MKILICTIMRDNEKFLPRYFSQLKSFVTKLSDKHTFYLSIYENDSKDNTARMLREENYSLFPRYSVISGLKNTKKFGSVVAEERVKNLAHARNNAMLVDDMYKDVDYIMFIDSDIEYQDEFIYQLLNWKEAGIPDPDVYSGLNVVPQQPHENNTFPSYTYNNVVYRVYDTWATRRNSNEEWGSWHPDALKKPIDKFYATYNGVCLFKAEHIRSGIRFDHRNQRLGKFDLEIACLCEQLHAAGHHNIYINQFLWCHHNE